MRTLKTILLLLIAAYCTEPLSAQYYSWGSDAPMKWSRMKGERVEVVYPDTTQQLANRVLYYINAIQPDISKGFYKPALDIPFVIHPENFSSNGLVMWMPKRIEFISTPDVDSYSMLWSKQLVAHEYRHAVQYNNLNNGWIKAFSYILGQQGSAIGLAFMPLFAIEGDAVLVETQMSTYGRGLQPSFSMEYRAMGDDLFNRGNSDKWFCGSYIDNIPDHYRLGYQFMSYAYEKYGENIWNKAIRYTTRNPYLVFSSSAGLRKYYDTSVETLTRETFAELDKLWRPLRERSNSTEQISRTDSSDYVTYSHPIPLANGEVLSLKKSFNMSDRFVIFDVKGEERSVLKTGIISSRPSSGGGRVWWTEYRRSKLFDEKVNSQLCYMDIQEGKARWVRGLNKVLFAEAIGEDSDHIAYVEYHPSGHYVVIERYKDSVLRELSVDFPTEIHGLAWDDTSDKLYIIATDDSGMWLGVESNDHFERLHEGRYITISNLRAQGGRLYFGSIASGLDELHCYDIASGVETQISSSTYGSFQPSEPTSEGYIYATTYDKYGYHLSRQSAEEVEGITPPSHTPQNIVNPQRASLGFINLDSVRYNAIDTTEFADSHPPKKYSKGGHIVKVHSWMPIRINPIEFIEEFNVDVGLGATLVSQNLLSSSEGYLSYGYDFTQGSLISGSLTYSGLGVNLSLGASWGGDRQIYTFEGVPLPTFSASKYLSFSAVASLPLYYQRGAISRQLTLMTGWGFSNGKVLDMESPKVAYNNGLNKLYLGVSFSTYTRSSYRDITTPFGYYVSTSFAMDPTNRDFSSLLATYAKVYLPGFAPHNSLTVAFNYQTNIGGYRIGGYPPLSYTSVNILPRGYLSSEVYNNNYFASALDYELPVWYPDGGIESVIYFKRIRLKGGIEYAQYDDYFGGVKRLYSYGGGIIADINPFRLPASGGVEVEFSIYKPLNKSLNYEVGLSIPF